MQTLWGDTKIRRRRKRRTRQQRAKAPSSITGTGRDCEIIGHTVNHYDLAGTTTCIDCKAAKFCPQCIEKHPTDPQAAPVLCTRHEESQVNHAL